VIELWLNTGSGDVDIFVNGSMLMLGVWKNRHKWVFEGILFSIEATRIMESSMTPIMESA